MNVTFSAPLFSTLQHYHWFAATHSSSPEVHWLSWLTIGICTQGRTELSRMSGHNASDPACPRLVRIDVAIATSQTAFKPTNKPTTFYHSAPGWGIGATTNARGWETLKEVWQSTKGSFHTNVHNRIWTRIEVIACCSYEASTLQVGDLHVMFR
jgi:hypothetical protein